MPHGPSLWRGPAPLLLASTSDTRRRLLAGAGLPVETQAPDIDERALEVAQPQSDGIARRLAREKALAVSRLRPGRLVVGADQTLACDSRLFHKPAGRAAAREQLAALAGRTHFLLSAFALAEDGMVVHEGFDEARMTMRDLGARDIDCYLDHVGDAAWRSVGAYQVEGPGVHLFARIDGDHAPILGLPLIPLLEFLRDSQLLAF